MRSSLIFVIAIFIFSSCEKQYYIDKNENYGIAYPISLHTDSLRVDLRKYLGKDTRLKSVNSHKNIFCDIKDSIFIDIKRRGIIPNLSNLRLNTTKGSFDILIINSSLKENYNTKPLIIGRHLSDDIISYTITKIIDTTFIYVNNKKISLNKLVIEDSIYKFTIPKFSSIPHNAILRIYASSIKYGLSNEFCIPLRDGKFVNDVSNIDTLANSINKDINLYNNAEYFKLYKEAVNYFIYSKHSYTYIDSLVSSSISINGAYRLINNELENKYYMPIYKDLAFKDKRVSERLQLYKKPRNISKIKNSINQLNAFLMTIPGIPSYYIKLSSNDVHYTGQEFSFEKIENLRKNNFPLLYGSYHSLRNDDLTYAYVRKYFDEFSIIIFNRSKYMRKRKIELHTSFIEAEAKALFESRFDIVKGKLIIELQPYSVEIITGRITK